MNESTNKVNYGELYFDHYEKYLGFPTGREVSGRDNGLPEIQLLVNDGVFEDCMVYSSLGLSSYKLWIGINAEVSMVVDGGFDDVGYILTNALFHCVDNCLGLRRGVAVGGVDLLDKQFFETYGKSAIYFTDPYGLPDEYREVSTGNDDYENGRILFALFITPSEHAYFKKYGAEKFEDLLEEKDADLFNISRESILYND